MASIKRNSSTRKFSPVKEPVAVASLEQWSQRIKDERSAYKDLHTSVCGQLGTYSDMSAHGGSILEDLRSLEAILTNNKTLNPNTMDIVRSSLQFQHSLNTAFGRLSTALNGTVCTKLDYYSKDGRESKIKDDKEILKLMQESEERLVGVFENYWKCYVEFFRQGYQLGLNLKNFFVKIHPEDPVFVEVPKAFGKELNKVWEDESDLRVVIYILKYFEEHGSLDESVLKTNVPPEAVKSIIQALEKGTIPLTGNTEAMAHVLLHFINSLPDPIFPTSLQKDFLDTASLLIIIPDMVNMQAKKEKMSSIIGKMPKPNRVVLLAIIRGCVKIAREKSVGNLRYTQILLEKIADLAAALGPSLTRCSPEHVPLSLALIRYLVLNSELFFPLGCDEERTFITETMKLGRVARLTGELPPPPSLVTPLSSSLTLSLSSSPSLSSSNELSSSPKTMKIGERNSSKSNISFSSSSSSSSSSPFHSSSSLNISNNNNNNSNNNNNNNLSSSPSRSRNSPPSDEDGLFSTNSNSNSNNINNNNNFSSNNNLINNFLSPTIRAVGSGSGIGIGVRSNPSSLTSSFSSSSLSSPYSSPSTLVRASSISSFISSTSSSSSPSPSLSTSSSTSSISSNDPGIISNSAQKSPPTTPRKYTLSDDQPLVFEPDNINNNNINNINEITKGKEKEPMEKLAREVIVKISQIKSKAVESEVFDEAFAQVLKLKIVVPEVENIKTMLQMGLSEIDKSELSRARGDRLARVRTTVLLFSREIIYVMEGIESIFNSCEVPLETCASVRTSLLRILTQLG